jgi:hypothetical protein
MSDKAWLKRVLAEANVSNQSRPDWARNSSVQVSLNSLPESDSKSNTPPTGPDPKGKNSAGQEGLKFG